MSQQAPEQKLELESQFILRLPQNQANLLREAIKSGEPLSKRLLVKFETDIRTGTVKFDNTTMPARLYDLPTIIESYKTLDRKNFYKTADISQILICKEDTSDSSIKVNSGDTEEDPNKSKYDALFSSIGGAGKREFLYPHGITPPLKNVRKRRFRKTLKKKYVDFSEIEKEVKRLFKADCDAVDSTYEIVEEIKDKAQPSQFNQDNAPSPMSGPMQSAENSQNCDYQALFGEQCSSSNPSDDDDDDDDDDEKEDDMDLDQENDNDDDNMDDEELEEVVPPPPQPPSEPAVPAADIAAEIAAASDLISQNDDTEEKRQECIRELAKIRERIHTQENEMRGLDNQALRMRLQPVLDSLHEQENEMKKELEQLSKNM